MSCSALCFRPHWILILLELLYPETQLCRVNTSGATFNPWGRCSWGNVPASYPLEGRFQGPVFALSKDPSKLELLMPTAAILITHPYVDFFFFPVSWPPLPHARPLGHLAEKPSAHESFSQPLPSKEPTLKYILTLFLLLPRSRLEAHIFLKHV